MENTYVFDGVVLESRSDESGRKVLFVLLENPEGIEKQHVRVNISTTARIQGSGRTVRGAGSVVFGKDPHIIADVLSFSD